MTKRHFLMTFTQENGDRPETGVAQLEGTLTLGNDWPGVFIRGDNAHGWAVALQYVLEDLHKTGGDTAKAYGLTLQGLVELLESCHVDKVMGVPEEHILWRQGDDGNPMEFGRFPSRAAAEAKMAELEAGKPHKQVYWVSALGVDWTRA